MAVTTQSQAIKNQASALRRTASSVRNLAESFEKAGEQAKALSRAAQIIEAHAGMLIQKSKAAAKDEKRFDDAFAKALPIAEKLVQSLPMETIAQKLAILNKGYQGEYLKSCLIGTCKPHKPLAKVLQQELSDALRDIAKSLAFASARSGRAPEISEQFMLTLKFDSQGPTIAATAKAFDEAVAAQYAREV